MNQVKTFLSGHSKIDKTKVLMANGSLIKVKSIAECSPAILLTCIQRESIWERGRLRQVSYNIYAVLSWNHGLKNTKSLINMALKCLEIIVQ